MTAHIERQDEEPETDRPTDLREGRPQDAAVPGPRPGRPRRRPQGRLRRHFSDERERHPVENGLATLALLLGLVSVGAVVARAWTTAAWTGLTGGLIAAYALRTSRTSAERWVLLVGFPLCVVGVAVSMANGAITH